MSLLPKLLGSREDGATGGPTMLVAFVADPRTEESVRNLVDEQSIAPAIVRRGVCRDAIAYLAKAPPPRMLIVDLSGSEMPLSDMDELINVCGPNVIIIALGEVNDIALYRDLTMFGVADYMVKPVTTEVLRRIVGIQTGGRTAGRQRQRLGRVICVTGARGGVGATTFATNLAWMLSNDAARRTAIVDLDLHCGSVSLMLGLKHSVGFMEALNNPHRIDDLFLDRAIVKKSERLMVLSAEEPLEDDVDYSPAALEAVLRSLQQRFHYTVMDLPRRPGVLYRQVLEKSEIQIILASSTLTALRDAMRISRLIGREDLGQRALLVINHTAPSGRGDIPRTDFEKTIGRRIDHEVAFSRHAIPADNKGEMLAQQDAAYAEVLGRIVNDLTGRSSAQRSADRRIFGFKRR